MNTSAKAQWDQNLGHKTVTSIRSIWRSETQNMQTSATGRPCPSLQIPLAGRRESTGLWLPLTVMMWQSKAEREESSIKVGREENKLYNTSLLIPCLSVKLPQASNPILRCLLGRIYIEHGLPVRAHDTPRSSIPKLTVLSAKKMLMWYWKPRIQERKHLGQKNNEEEKQSVNMGPSECPSAKDHQVEVRN